jgi:hypothetical protein
MPSPIGARGCAGSAPSPRARRLRWAAIPALGTPLEPDPVFALLEAHKAAWARFDAITNFDDHEACERAAGAVDAALGALRQNG